MHLKGKQRKIFITLISFIGILGLLWSISTKNGLGVRVGLVHLSVNMFKENYVNGIGYGQFLDKQLEYRTDEFAEIHPSLSKSKGDHKSRLFVTHNDFFRILAELGILGVLFIVFYLYNLFAIYKNSVFRNNKYTILTISLLMGTLIFSMFHNNFTSFVFWFIMFLPFIINKIYKPAT